MPEIALAELTWKATALGFCSACGRYSVRSEGDGWRPRVFRDAAADVPEFVGLLYDSAEAAKSFCEVDARIDREIPF